MSDGRTHTHTPNYHGDDYVSLTASRLHKKNFDHLPLLNTLPFNPLSHNHEF